MKKFVGLKRILVMLAVIISLMGMLSISAFAQRPRPTRTTISDGNWWIIAIGAVVIVGGVVAIIVANKKKNKSEISDSKRKQRVMKTEISGVKLCWI